MAATLTTLFPSTNPEQVGDNTLQTLLGFPYWNEAGYYTPMEAYDFPGFKLTMQDGTKYEMERPMIDPNGYFSVDEEGNEQFVLPRGKAKVTRITQRSNDRIEIGDTQIKHVNPAGAVTRSIWLQRDELGRIKGINDPIGGAPVVKYTYNDKGNLSEVARLVNRSPQTYVTNRYSYTNMAFPHYLTGIEDARGITVAKNLYDDSGRLIAIVDADGRTNRFHHDLIGKTETITNRLGDRTIHAYDTRGNVVQTIDALGNNTYRGYDSTNNLIWEANHLNQTNWFFYDTNRFLIATRNPLGHTNRTVYNAFGQVKESYDALGRGTTNSYDSNGNLTSTTDALGIATTFLYDNKSQLTAQIDAMGTVSTNTYDSLGNLTSTAVRNAAGTVLSTNTYQYDGNGNRTVQTVTRTLADGTKQGMSTLYFYDAQSRLVRTREPDNFFSTNVYNSIGQQQHTIDKLGRTNTFEYDAQGRMFKHTYPDGTFELSFYDAEGRRTNSVDRGGRATTYVYDKLGRLTKTIFADGATLETVFDSAGRASYTLDARGTITAFGYDDAGRRTSITNALGTSIQAVSRYTFDPAGNLTNMIDALGRVTDYEYDALNRQVRTIYPATVIGGSRPVTLTGYDVLGQKIVETNETDIVTRFGYDGLGRLVAVTNAHGMPEATWATYAYDEAGNQTNQIDALGRMTRYEYDNLGRRIRRILPGAQKESFVYDPVGNLLRHTNFINSLVITNEYDSMNRVLRKWSGSMLLESYAYTATGQRATRTDESGSYTWTYDLRDRVRTNSTPVGALFYVYDRNGNLTNLFSSTPNGVSLAYEYDALNRVTNVIDNRLTGTKNTAYTFDLAGNLKTLKYPNAVTNHWQYDARNRLTNEVWKLNTTTLASFFYQLALAGNRTNLTETVDNVSRTYSGAYDSLYRLTNEVITGEGTLSYGYDLVSNRTNRQSTVPELSSATYGYTNNDWLTNDTYDANGNTIASSGVGYAYDWGNRLTNSGSISIAYNADNHRIKKTTATTTTLFLVDGQNLIGYPRVVEELTVSGSITNLSRVYTYGLDLISQRQSDGTVHFYGYDGHGSTRFLVNGSGGITDSYAYDGYGTLIASNGSTVNLYLYTAEQFDWDLGFYVLGPRQMNPNTGRFWTRDPFEGFHSDPLSLHKYLYANADPITFRDPSGYFSLAEINASTAIRVVLITMNIAGAIANARQTAKYSVAAFEAIANDDPWNATLAIAGAVMHGGLTAMNVLGVKSFMSSIGPPPAGGFAVAGSGAVTVGRVWRFALSNPPARQWIFNEFLPVVATGIGLFTSHMGHQAEWEHRDPSGKIKTRGNSESGSDVPPGRRLSWNEQLQVHTEYKILAQLSGTTKPGDIITIRGTLDPCDPGGRGCQAVMDEFARINQVRIIYKSGNKVWTFQNSGKGLAGR